MNRFLTIRIFLFPLLVCFLLWGGGLFSGEPVAAEGRFYTDNWQTLRLNNHAKATGLDFSIKYPAGWTVSEGNRPHIVKKLTKGKRIFIILVQKLPQTISTADADNMFTEEDIKEMVPKRAVLQTCRKTKLEGQTAWIMLYSMQTERLGTKLWTMTIACQLVYRSHMLNLQSSCCFTSQEVAAFQKSPEMQAQYKAFLMDSMQIFNTLVIYNRY